MYALPIIAAFALHKRAPAAPEGHLAVCVIRRSPVNHCEISLPLTSSSAVR